MKTLSFSKYHGTGNDFVIIDNRQHSFPKNNTELIAELCNRRFGVGADGLILLEACESNDFKMIYYNSDGNLSSMCGNGGRCLVHFAAKLGIINDQAVFEAVDGVHDATINGDVVELGMNDVNDIELGDGYGYMDTGSPHYLSFEEDIDELDLVLKAHEIRYNDRFKEKGTNVNYLQMNGTTLKMRTYERGVEAETLSCGTGVVAAAIYADVLGKTTYGEGGIKLSTKGGDVNVKFQKNEGNHYSEIKLIGSATFVYKGEINVRL
ncbi:MAG: diaminopimelate epimerase [Bacteroidetes bacterium]|nr:MAG: diaminopimelate epimerase [Bacteroidota bacterium]